MLKAERCKEEGVMRKLLLIGRWFRGRNKVVVDLQAYREQKEKRNEQAEKHQRKNIDKPRKETP